MPKLQSPAYLTSAQVAALIGVSRTTMKRWRLLGKGPPAIVLHGRTVRYEAERVHAWLASNQR